MVEHMNAPTVVPQSSHSQSLNGTRQQRFSLLRWFRRRSKPTSKHQRRVSSSSSSSTISSASSFDSLYSTATVRSFAFHSGGAARKQQAVDAVLRLHQQSASAAAVGPFAAGAVKLCKAVDPHANNSSSGATCTLPSGFSQTRDLRARYALQPASAFISYDNLPRRRDFNDNDTLTSLSSSASGTTTTTTGGTARPRLHVKGKRRAPDPPDPPEQQPTVNARGCRPRKRRPAPKPPGHLSHNDTLSSEAMGMDSLLAAAATASRDYVSNDTLVLRRGLLRSKRDDSESSSSSSAALSPRLAAAMMPRPWYKRNVFGDQAASSSRDSTAEKKRVNSSSKRNGDVLRNWPSPLLLSADIKDGNLSSTSNSPTQTFPFEGSSLSRLAFFRHHNDDDKKKESKRKSAAVSILSNISQLDKEAAAIVQEEQARNRASSYIIQAAKLDQEEFEKRMAANEQIVQDIVNSSLLLQDKSPLPPSPSPSPSRRSARALISSKFNALPAIPRINLNSNNFFSRHARATSQSPKANRRDLSSRYFPAEKPSPPKPKMESASMFTEVIGSQANDHHRNQVKAADNIEFAKTLAKELDDVATGIARLRRELDDRPKLLPNNENTDAKPKDDSAKRATPCAPGSTNSKHLANFDKEFTKIFDEIDRQLRPRNSGVLDDVKNNPTTVVAPSTSNVLERIAHVVNKGDKNVSSGSKETKNRSDNVASKEAKTKETAAAAATTSASVVRISGIDDKTTNDLKEMLKEMKHSLPKRPKPEKEAEKEAEKEKESNINRAASTSSGKASTKVSSGVQTSGNVRRIVVKPSENTYANVNAQEQPRVKIDLRLADNAQPLPAERASAARAAVAAERPDKSRDETKEKKLEEIKKQYMNTLAVNRLLRKLEAAIASGNHQQAALLAKELAQLKIHCSVVRQRSCNATEKLKLNMYIEDKQAHQGPIPLQLPVNMRLAQLKAKIQLEFDIPANVQRWIIGKNLADDDEATLRDLQATDGSALFLYLVAPPDLQLKETIKEDKEGEKQAERVINEKNDEPEIKAEIKLETAAAAAAATAAATEASAAEPQARQEKEGSMPREEKLKRYEELMSLENCDVIVTAEPIECPVCLMISVPGEGVTLRDCLHSFCRDCVANTVRYCEEAEVKCPYRDADYTCESTLQEREIKALVTAQVYQQHLAKSIAQAENSAGNNAFHCKTPDCPGWCIYDDDVNNFLCPVCKVNNCLTCQAVHMGKNCRQYQEELKYSKETDHESKRTAAMLEEMVDRGEALSCPTCAVVLMKKWGCDWLRCSMCKTEICWVTRGPRWGPGGKGDTSGGCKCGENGIKCHPKCNYCH